MTQKFSKIFLILFSMFILFPSSVDAKSYNPAYALYDTPIYYNGSIVGKLKQGTVINAVSITGSSVSFKYYGKNGYVQRGDMLSGDNFVNYVKQHPYDFGKKVRAIKSRVPLYNKIGGKKIGTLSEGEVCLVTYETHSWFKVSYSEQSGYVKKGSVKASFLIDLANFEKKNSTSNLRNNIVDYAKQFVGNPYVWGGTSLTSGADCSGFVQSVLKKFGISVPRVSYQQCYAGKAVSLSDLRPGDLVFYKRGSRVGHVVMYIGNGKCVQARGSAYGIVITSVYYDKPYRARNVID